MLTQPYITIDVETKGGRPTDAERHMRMLWSPAPNWKPETIGNRWLEALEAKKQKLALIDGSGIISVALALPGPMGDLLPVDLGLHCFHCMYEHPAQSVGGSIAKATGYKTEAEMLTALAQFLDSVTDEATCLVGHNIIDFDLKKLRMSYARLDVEQPHVLQRGRGDEPCYDTMRMFGAKYSSGKDAYVALADVQEVFGMPTHKHLVDGSQIEQLYAAGQYDEIVAYNIADVVAEHRVFRRMVGRKDTAA